MTNEHRKEIKEHKKEILFWEVVKKQVKQFAECNEEEANDFLCVLLQRMAEHKIQIKK